VSKYDVEIGGILGLLIAIPIVVVTFGIIAAAFVAVVAVLLSPLILLILLLSWMF
jgi:hypothetical protein